MLLKLFFFPKELSICWYLPNYSLQIRYLGSLMATWLAQARK